MPTITLRVALTFGALCLLAFVVLAVKSIGSAGYHYPWLDRFPRQTCTAHFFIATNGDANLLEVGEVAETALGFTSELLGAADSIPAGNLPLIVCAKREDVWWLEELYRIPYSRDPRKKRWGVAGGYYAQVPIIAFEETARPTAETVSHEVSHYVSSYIAQAPDVINEGLAMYVEGALLPSDDVVRWHHRRALVCADALSQGAVPNMETLFGLDYWAFRAPRDGLYFCLSWCLINALVHAKERRIATALPTYLRALKATANPWEEFKRHYPVSRVDELWRAEIERVATARLTRGTARR